MDNIRSDIGMQGTYAREIVLVTKKENKEKLLDYASTLDEDINELKNFISSHRMKKYMDEFFYYEDAINKGLDQIIKYAENGNVEAATKVITQNLLGANYGILNTSDNILLYQNEELEAIKTKTASSINTSMIVSVVLSILSILFTVFSIIMVRRSITSPFGQVMESAEQLAIGLMNQRKL